MRSLKQNNILFFLVSILLISACVSKSFDSEKEYLTFLYDESNGYLYSKNVNDFKYSLLYRPVDLMVNTDLERSLVNHNVVDSLRNKYGEFLYFSLSMSKNNKELLSVVPKNKQEYGVLSKQLTFDMRDKVHLFTQKKDTIDLIDFVYSKLYGMSNSTDLLFVFPRDKKFLNGEYLNFTIEDFGLFTGEVKFKVPIKNIINEPKINY